MAHKPYLPKKSAAAARKRNSNLPIYLIGAALGLVVLGIFLLFGRSPSTPDKAIEVAGKPKLAVDREQIDFGKLPLNKPVRAEFEVSNVGDQALQILGVPAVEVREGC